MITYTWFLEVKGPKGALDRTRGRLRGRGPIAGGSQVLRRPMGGRSCPCPSTSLGLSLWAVAEGICFTRDHPVFSVLALSAVGFQNQTLVWSALSSPCIKAYTEDVVETKAVSL